MEHNQDSKNTTSMTMSLSTGQCSFSKPWAKHGLEGTSPEDEITKWTESNMEGAMGRPVLGHLANSSIYRANWSSITNCFIAVGLVLHFVG